MDIKAEVIAWLQRQPRSAGIIIKPDTDLVNGGVLGSLELLALISWIETKFDQKLSYAELDLKNFETVDQIMALIARPRALAG